MKDQTSEENSDSFSLNQQKKSKATDDDVTWQERAYDRLKILYRISKLLSSFDSVEETFPKIVALAAETFPLATVVLIDNWRSRPKTVVWHSKNATHEQTVAAALYASKLYAYLSNLEKIDDDFRKNCIVLPLIVDALPPLGALQLEGFAQLNEKDLEFVDALAGLISVALDRYYKTLSEQELRKEEDKLSSGKLTDLETERDLREGFVSLLTHDLRTPLAAAKMAAELMEGNSKENQDLLSRVLRNLQHADEMICNLLDANRIRSGEKLPIHLESFDLVTLIKKTITELALVHGDLFVLTGVNQLKGFWDPKGIRRIIENLCINAIKYGAAGAPVVVELLQNNNEVQISIQNQGNLISEDDQKSIFVQFKRSKNSESGIKQGWGIGLTLVRDVAEAHGGKVTVKSEPNTGTVFTVTLPHHLTNNP